MPGIFGASGDQHSRLAGFFRPSVRLALGSAVAISLLSIAGATPSAALTPQQILEKMFPKVKPARTRHVRPRAMPAENDAERAADRAPIPVSVSPPLPPAKPAASPTLADASADGAIQVTKAAMPLPRSNPLRDAEASAGDSDGAPTPKSVVSVTVDPHHAAEMAVRAREAVSMMAGDPLPPTRFEELAFAPPTLALPLAVPHEPDRIVPVSPPLLPEAVTPKPVSPIGMDPATTSPAAIGPTRAGALVPIPRPKPPVVLAALTPSALPAPARPAPALTSSACQAGLAGLKISAAAHAPVASGTCGAADPYDISALDGGAVTVEPKATINCEMATHLAQWLDQKVQPAAIEKLGGRVTGLQVADSYSCRPRDNIAGAQLSEHAFMNAVDIGAFQVGGKWIPVEKPADRTQPQQAFLDLARQGACQEFLTVLGPGSDSYHSSHFHLDMRHRGKYGDTVYCH